MAETFQERLAAAWARTDRLFELVAPDAWLAQPIALRHPFVFYLGHLPAFAWNHVCAGVLERPSLDPYFDDLFSRGIDPDVDDPARCHDHPDIPDHWPSVQAIEAYRDRVREAVLGAVEEVLERQDTHVMARHGRVLSMVIEHELMHQETLLYMFQQARFEQKRRPEWYPPYVFGGGRTDRKSPARIDVAPGSATLGADVDALAFGWDNESPAASALVPAFAIDATPVTNARFLAFVEAGGYERPELWSPPDWSWREEAGMSHPVVWQRRGSRWLYRAMFDLLPLEEAGDWPVYVSLAEARAYARWQGRRLPTEAEYQRAAYGDPDGGERPAPWGDAPPSAPHGNFDFRHWAPTPVGSHPAGASAWGVHDLVGDGWEWTETPFDGFPGFEPWIPGYPGYSADFFDGKHYVLKGASWATAADLVRPTFRNWYQARYPYVFAKFRCV